MSEYVIMPKADYTAACNAIRTKTGKADLIKSGDMEGEILAIESDGGGSDVPYTTITVTAKRANVVMPGATVTAVNGTETATGVTGEDGKCILKVSKSGTWSITVSKDGGTVTTSTYVSFSQYNATATLFHATIKVGCEVGATITVKKPDGSAITKIAENATTQFTIYSSGTHTVTVEYNGATKAETISVNTTVGNTYSVNLYVTHLDLETTSWEQIRAISDEGNAANYFAVGDTKSVALNGTVGTLTVNATYYVYIIGINHNVELEGNGIHFGCFKTSGGTDIALVDSTYGYSKNGANLFCHNNAANSSEQWHKSILRTTILGSKGTFEYEGSATAPTEVYTTTNTLLGAIPSELRNAIKPVTKYCFYYGAGNVNRMNYFVKDYFSLLGHYEVTGTIDNNTDDKNNKYATYCKQYEYYANGASKIKYKHNAQTTTCKYWTRSQSDQTNYGRNLEINESGKVEAASAALSYGLAPIFVV